MENKEVKIKTYKRGNIQHGVIAFIAGAAIIAASIYVFVWSFSINDDIMFVLRVAFSMLMVVGAVISFIGAKLTVDGYFDRRAVGYGKHDRALVVKKYAKKLNSGKVVELGMIYEYTGHTVKGEAVTVRTKEIIDAVLYKKINEGDYIPIMLFGRKGIFDVVTFKSKHGTK